MLVATSNPDDCGRDRAPALDRRTACSRTAARAARTSLSGDADHVLLTSSRICGGEAGEPRTIARSSRTASTSRVPSPCSPGRCPRADTAMLQAAAGRRPPARPPRRHLPVRARGRLRRRPRPDRLLGDLRHLHGPPGGVRDVRGYDEVAHHSGHRAGRHAARRCASSTSSFGRIGRALRYAPRPYEIVVLSDHGQTQGATFKQRYGQALDDVVRGALDRRDRVAERRRRGREPRRSSRPPMTRHRARRHEWRRSEAKKPSVLDSEAVVLASGNLGLVYLMREPSRLTLEEIERAYPTLISTLRAHPGTSASSSCAPPSVGRSCSARAGSRRLADDAVEGEDPLAPFGRSAARHLRRGRRVPARAPTSWSTASTTRRPTRAARSRS